MRKTTLLLAMCLGLHFMGNAQQREAAPFNTIGKTQTKEIVSEPTVTETSEAVDADSLNEQESMGSDTTTYYVPLMVSLPLKEIKVNSPFGMRRDPMNRKKSRMHNGLDLKECLFDVPRHGHSGILLIKRWVLCHGGLWCMHLFIPAPV